MLKVTNLQKRFGDITVLDGVSLSLEAGETLALTGESGSGKSTLLHLVAGLEDADSGSITLDGDEVTGMDDTARAHLRRDRIGIVFQQFNLIPSLSVAANITFQARLSGQSINPDRLDDLTSQLGIADQLEKYPEQLSGGQQQRVAIARAVLPAPPLILADEPTGNLDETAADAVFDQLLAQARVANSALLIVTHSEKLAARADRRVHLTHGRITA